MINPFQEINWQPSLEERKSFGKSLLIGFPPFVFVLAFLARAVLGEFPSTQRLLFLLIAGLSVGLFARLLPRFALPFYWLWFGFAACVGLVMSNLLLSAVFYLLFTPLGWARRLLGSDPLVLKRPSGAATYWKELPPPRPAADYFSQS